MAGEGVGWACASTPGVGTIGLGNIGSEFVRLVRTFGRADSRLRPLRNRRRGGARVELVSLETLLRDSDFVIVNCLLNKETRHLLGARELALMKPTAYLVNCARGGIVDPAALYEALATGRIAGAALDVFELSRPTQPIHCSSSPCHRRPPCHCLDRGNRAGQRHRRL